VDLAARAGGKGGSRYDPGRIKKSHERSRKRGFWYEGGGLEKQVRRLMGRRRPKLLNQKGSRRSDGVGRHRAKGGKETDVTCSHPFGVSIVRTR